MAFKLFFRTRGDNQIGHLRRQEATQPAHALDFVYLVGDALLQVLIELLYFLCSVAQFFEKSCVLDGKPYEVTAMKRLMGRYGTKADELDQLLRAKVFVDLYGVVRKGLRAGVDSYSIKKLENFYGLTRKVDLKPGFAPSSGR